MDKACDLVIGVDEMCHKNSSRNLGIPARFLPTAYLTLSHLAALFTGSLATFPTRLVLLTLPVPSLFLNLSLRLCICQQLITYDIDTSKSYGSTTKYPHLEIVIHKCLIARHVSNEKEDLPCCASH